jgi:hypothetical protein
MGGGKPDAFRPDHRADQAAFGEAEMKPKDLSDFSEEELWEAIDLKRGHSRHSDCYEHTYRLTGNLPWGFFFGSAVVNRLFSDRTGVGIEVETKRESVFIRITKGGRITVDKPLKKNRATTSRDIKP